MNILRTLTSTDDKLKMLIIERSDGLFQVGADELRPADEEFEAYWMGPFDDVLHGIFESAENAELEAMSSSYFRGRFSH